MRGLTPWVLVLLQTWSFAALSVLSLQIIQPGDVVAGRPFTLQCIINRQSDETWVPLVWTYSTVNNPTRPQRIYSTDNCTSLIQLSATSPQGLKGGCQVINGQEVYTVTIQNVTDDLDRSKWLCNYGSDSNRITLDVKVMVERVTLTGPQDAVLAGDSSTYTCVTSPSKPQACINWYIQRPGNTTKINQGEPDCDQTSTSVSSTTRTLRFTPTAEENGAYLYCTANNSVTDPPVQSQSYTLIVQFEPVYVVLTTNVGQFGNAVRVTESNTVTFNCIIGEANPAANFTWYNTTNPVTKVYSDSTQSGPNHGYLRTQLYTVTVDRYQDGDVIKCHGRWRGNTMMNNSLTLNITYRPVISCQTYHTYNENDDVQLVCDAQAKPDATFTWTYLSGGQWTNQTESLPGHTQRTALRINKISRTDAGVYTVTARNIVGSDSFYINITVYYSPDVKVISQHGSEVNEGSSVQLECRAEGLPTNYTYSLWSHLIGDRQLPPISQNSGRYVTIRNVTFRDQGTYRCGVSNGIGGYQQNQTEIRVKARPQLSEQTRRFAAAIGETVQLSVGFVSYPSYKHITWYKIVKGAVDILDVSGENGSKYRQSVTEDQLDFVFYGLSVTIPGQTVSLEISTFQLADFTDYMLTVENELGYFNYTVSVSALVRPNVPKLQQTTCIEGKGNVTWISSFNGGSTQTFSLEYRKEGEVWKLWRENISDPGENKTLSETVTGLVAGDKYKFRVHGQNRWDNSDSVEIGCMVEETQDVHTGNDGLKIGLAVGVSLSVLLIIGVVLFFVVRRQWCFKPGVGRRNLSQQSTTSNVNSDTVTQGHLYQSLTMARLVPSTPVYQNTSPEYENTSYDNTLSQGSHYEKLQMQKVPNVDRHLYENTQISSITPAVHSQISS